MNKLAYMVVGCPGSGKTWVCSQLVRRYCYVPHDAYIAKTSNQYLEAIRRAAETTTRPLLIETPFSMSQLEEPLTAKGFHVVPVFIQESDKTLKARYLIREGKPIPDAHLARQRTYRERGIARGAFMGTSSDVLMHLQSIAPERMPWEP